MGHCDLAAAPCNRGHRYWHCVRVSACACVRARVGEWVKENEPPSAPLLCLHVFPLWTVCLQQLCGAPCSGSHVALGSDALRPSCRVAPWLLKLPSRRKRPSSWVSGLSDLRWSERYATVPLSAQQRTSFRPPLPLHRGCWGLQMAHWLWPHFHGRHLLNAAGKTQRASLGTNTNQPILCPSGWTPQPDQLQACEYQHSEPPTTTSATQPLLGLFLRTLQTLTHGCIIGTGYCFIYWAIFFPSGHLRLGSKKLPWAQRKIASLYVWKENWTWNVIHNKSFRADC